jgi:hypothetical protein
MFYGAGFMRVWLNAYLCKFWLYPFAWRFGRMKMQFTGAWAGWASAALLGPVHQGLTA